MWTYWAPALGSLNVFLPNLHEALRRASEVGRRQGGRSVRQATEEGSSETEIGGARGASRLDRLHALVDQSGGI